MKLKDNAPMINRALTAKLERMMDCSVPPVQTTWGLLKGYRGRECGCGPCRAQAGLSVSEKTVWIPTHSRDTDENEPAVAYWTHPAPEIMTQRQLDLLQAEKCSCVSCLVRAELPV